ncbi:hypothetical protein ACTVM6_23975, partial [Serratia bockelmannii]|uniref:hypothetical protein n=1 Tax=Serratia bockelmannii TaxID=2703793 RepID=UPI003FA69C0E
LARRLSGYACYSPDLCKRCQIIPNRDNNAENNCITIIQPIKNMFAQHFDNTIFSSTAVITGISQWERGCQGRDVIS